MRRIWARRMIGPLRFGKIMSISRKTSFQTVPLSEVPKHMKCEEKARLATKYDDATLALSNAVQQLRTKIGTSPKAEYERLARTSRKARAKSEQARLALEQHLATHRC
jgi:hypothetical protein